MRRPMLWWALRVAYFKVHHPLYYYCAYFSIRAKAFDIKTMGQALRPWNRGWKKSLKRKNNEASNVEIDLYTTLEIVNEDVGAGLQVW